MRLFKYVVMKIVQYFNKNIKYKKSKKIINQLVKNSDTIFLDIGSGNKKGNNKWLTLDLTENCDIYWDVRKGIPFPDESVDKIYSSHFLEHLTYQEGQRFLDECVRVLKSRGKFSISVPNARLYIKAYFLKQKLNSEQLFRYRPAYNNTTIIDYLNYTAYMGGHHKYMFDEENLLYILTSKDFVNVKLRKFDPHFDREDRDFESIYAEAEKP